MNIMLYMNTFQPLTIYLTVTPRLETQSLQLVTRFDVIFCLATISFTQTLRLALHT